MTDGLIARQRTSPAKIARAKQLRRDQTTMERQLWEVLRAKKLGGLHFRRQQVIDGLIADFYCHAAKLVIELDGEVHREQVEYDHERDRILAARGIHVLRIENSQVGNNLAAVVDAIRATARSRLADAPLPFREGAGG